jgi:hypothetical protein
MNERKSERTLDSHSEPSWIMAWATVRTGMADVTHSDDDISNTYIRCHTRTEDLLDKSSCGTAIEQTGLVDVHVLEALRLHHLLDLPRYQNGRGGRGRKQKSDVNYRVLYRLGRMMHR